MLITKEVEVDVDIEVDDLLEEMTSAERAELIAELGAGISPDSLTFQLQRLRQHAAGGNLDRFLDGVEQFARALDFPIMDTSRLRRAARITQAAA